MEKNPSSTSEKSTTLLDQAKAMAAQGNKVVAVALLSQYIAQAPEAELAQLLHFRADAATALLLAAKTEVAKEEKRKEEQTLSLGEAGSTWQKAAHAQMLSDLAKMAAEDDEYELDESENDQDLMVAEPED